MTEEENNEVTSGEQSEGSSAVSVDLSHIEELLEQLVELATPADDNVEIVPASPPVQLGLSTFRIKSQPSDFYCRVGDTVKLTVEASGSGLSYNWVYSDSGDPIWNNATFAFFRGSTLTFKMTEERLNYRFRCIVRDQSGGYAMTSPVGYAEDVSELRLRHVEELLSEVREDVAQHDLLSTNFADYTVAEGLLLLALIGGVVAACFKMLKGGLSWLSW